MNWVVLWSTFQKHIIRLSEGRTVKLMAMEVNKIQNSEQNSLITLHFYWTYLTRHVTANRNIWLDDITVQSIFWILFVVKQLFVWPDHPINLYMVLYSLLRPFIRCATSRAVKQVKVRLYSYYTSSTCNICLTHRPLLILLKNLLENKNRMKHVTLTSKHFVIPFLRFKKIIGKFWFHLINSDVYVSTFLKWFFIYRRCSYLIKWIYLWWEPK